MFLKKYELFEYYSKTLRISYIHLNEICKLLRLDINNIKFLSSGYYGNAYRIGDKVLKITNDLREANVL